MAEQLTRIRDRVIPRIMWVQAAVYGCVAATWYSTPTESRLSGLSVIPIGYPHLIIAVTLTVGSVLTALGAIVRGPYYRIVRIVGVCAGSVTPLLVAYPYLVSWMVGEAPRGHITAISYTGYSVIFIGVITAISRYTMDRAHQIRDDTIPDNTGGGAGE